MKSKILGISAFLCLVLMLAGAGGVDQNTIKESTGYAISIAGLIGFGIFGYVGGYIK